MDSGGVCCHNAWGHVRNRKSNRFDILFAQTWVHCDNKPDRSFLITVITWHFQFHLMNVSILHLKYEYAWCSKLDLFDMLLPLLLYMTPLNNGNCRNALPYTFNIRVFKSMKNNSTTIKHTCIYNDSASIIEGCNVAFHTSDWWNFP